MEATCNAFVVGVQTYYTPAIVFIGVFCNLLNVLVFTCTRLRSRSSSLYLASLAASDACFLFVLGLSWWSDNFGDAVLKNFGWCQFLLYLSVTSGFFSVWITVAFTTERLVAVRFPLHRSYICTFSRAKIIILVILALSLLCNLYTLFTTGKEDPKQGFVCDMKPQTLQYLKGIFVADLMLSLVIPLVMISIMNTLVVQSLVRSRSQLKFNVTASSSNAETIMIYSNDSSSRNMDEKPEVSSNVPNHTPDVVQRCISSSKSVQRSVTNMMLLISISFLVLSTPSYIVRLLIIFSTKDEAEKNNLKCVQKLCMLMYFTNFAINFLLYAFCGKAFRQCLVEILMKMYECCVGNVMKCFRCNLNK